MFRTDMFDLRPKADPAAVVEGENYRFTILTSRLIRMEWSEDGTFEDRATKLAICRRFPVPSFTVTETAERLEIVTEHLHLYYDKKPFSQAGLSIAIKGLIKHKCAKWHYGMPQIHMGGRSTNLLGTTSTLDMVDGPCELEDGILDRHGFVTVDDSDTMALGEDGWYRPSDRKGAVDQYFFGYLEEHKDCLRDFYHLTGASPMLPRYALGNWWSRFYKYTEESYEALIEKFTEKKIPLAVSVVDMDWHITQPDPKYGNGWTGYTWNDDFFPDPKRFMTWLHDHDLHITLNLHPCDGIRAFETCYPEVAAAMGIDPATEIPVEFDAADPNFMRTYLDKVLHPLEDDGVDFWWIDWQQQNGFSKAGYDPLWMLNHYLYADNARKGTYPLTLSRYAGFGSHRYPLGFSGDSIMSWESLDFQPYFTNCAANAGYGWWSHDIGGHKNGVWSDELQVRWLQYGVFSPINRLHSGKDVFFLKEPWNFPVNIENIMADFLRLRHELIPYLYTMNYRSHTDGVPLCRPMYYDYPHKMTNNLDFPNEFSFGTELVVCPITEKADPESLTGRVKAWIPAGTWYDFFTGRRYTGEKTMMLYRELSSYPVLAKAGGIVPLSGDGARNGAPLPKCLRVKAFCGADGAFDLYEDNERLADTKRAVTPLRFRWGSTASFTVEPVQGETALVPQSRDYALELVGLNRPERVTVAVNGKEVETAWHYCRHCHALRLTISGVTPTDLASVNVLTDGGLAENDWHEEIINRLARYQIDNVTKQWIVAEAKKSRGRGSLAASLASVCRYEYVLGELLEILTAAN